MPYKPEQTVRRLRALPALLLLFTIVLVAGGAAALRGGADFRLWSGMAAALVLCALGAFFLRFEGRRPQAREMVALSVLSALAAASRVAFVMTPLDIKPLLAIVIITGVGLGAEAGFLSGALSMLVSNFFFGQGPHTPWQMFAAGAVGCLAGLLFFRSTKPPHRLPLCVFGGLSVLLLYGPLMDLSTLLLTAPFLSVQTALPVFLSGLPFNLSHAAATVVFLFFLTRPMCRKLARLRKKYGLME